MSNEVDMEQTIGDFLLRRLKEAGLRHIFWVAGDFNLALLEQLERTDHINWVGCCNELAAGWHRVISFRRKSRILGPSR